MPATVDERGSLVIAMAVVLVLAGLSIVALARTVAAIGSARVAQDAAAAAAAADAGLTDAVAVLDAAPPVAPFPAPFGPGSGPVGDGTGGPASFRWTATAAGTGSVAIRSVGTVNGRQHQVDGLATRGPQWPWVLATTGSLILDGPGSVTGGIAAGGPLVLRSGASGGATQDLLGPGAACTGCSAANVARAPVTFPVAVVPSSPAPLPCPPTPVGDLDAGTYLCTGDIEFRPDTRVRGPVVLYQVNGAGGTGAPTAIRFSSGGVNGDGAAANLIIHKIGPGPVDFGVVTLAGIIDAPEGILASTGCGFRVLGAVLLGSFSCLTTGPGPTLTYGAGSVLTPAWTIGARRDAPVGSP
ncbi:MAG: hypothetical protein NVS1B12_02600 [Acidimicrobiales bacterium]